MNTIFRFFASILIVAAFFIAMFLAAFTADMATYLVTAGQLAAAFPDSVGGTQYWLYRRRSPHESTTTRSGWRRASRFGCRINSQSLDGVNLIEGGQEAQFDYARS